MGSGGPTYRGNLPYTDESIERLINAVSLWISAQQLGILRTALFDTSGNPVTIPSTGTSVGNGRKVVASAGTAEALAASTTIKKVIICAETDNTDYIVVGGSGVIAALATRQGIPIGPGDTITIDVDNLADVFIDAVVSGEGVTYTSII